MSIPVVILGATVYWPSTGEVNYGDDTTAFVELVSSALAPISGLYNSTTGHVGNLALDDLDQLTINGAPITPGPGSSGYSGFSGASGTSGYSGMNGFSTILRGSVADFASLPSGAAYGDMWMTLDTGDGWVSDGVGGWTNVGQIRGATGATGLSGYSGKSGWSGISGIGTSGYSGVSGFSGSSGTSGYSGILKEWTLVSNTMTATPNIQYLVDTQTNGPWTMTFPILPTLGDVIIISDNNNFATNNLTIDGNGQTFDSGDGTLTIDIGRVMVTFTYNSSTWRVVATAGPQGLSGYSGQVGISGYSGTNGAVTSVGISGTTGIGVTGSPVTSAGDITLALGAITPTSVSPTGNITLATSQKLLGDFSNATFLNRSLIQTSTTNGITRVSLVPNGTATQSRLQVHNVSSPTSGAGDALMVMDINSSRGAILMAINGTGPALPLYLLAGGGTIVDLALDISHNVIIGGESTLLATTATGGFLYLSGMNGAPTGVPITKANHTPLVYDKTNEALYYYNYTGAVWEKVATGTSSGTVTSVDVSVANGLTVSGNPITTSGTLALGLGPNVILGDNATVAGTLQLMGNGSTTPSNQILNNSDTSVGIEIIAGNSSSTTDNGSRITLANKTGTHTTVNISSTTPYDPLLSDICGGMVEGFNLNGTPSFALYSGDGNYLSTGGGGQVTIWDKTGTFQSVNLQGSSVMCVGIDVTVPATPTQNGANAFLFGGDGSTSANMYLHCPSDNGNITVAASNSATGDTAVGIAAATANGNAVSIDISTANGGTINLNAPIKMNSSTGTAGQVLTSNGSTTQTWQRFAPAYEEHVATAAQTVFNTTMVTTANGSGKSYLQVFVMGVLQQEGATKSYTVTGSNQITFNTGVTLSSDVLFYGY
jgi:hypothetical protein